MAGAKPNIGTAKVPDERLDWLADYYHPKKYTPATIEFVDVAGVNVGTGKSNEVFQAIRQTDALVHVVRCFDNDEIFLEPADAKRDAEAFDLELILADIEIDRSVVLSARRRTQRAETRSISASCEMCEALIAHLTDEKPARSFEFTDEDSDILVDGGLLTVKPVIYAANLDEDGMMNLTGQTNANFAALGSRSEQGAAVLPVAAKFEEDIAGMEPDEAEMFMADLGLTETGLDRLIKTSYDLLGYISFLTAGEDDVHAWTITRGTKAPKAAGKVHSDIERGLRPRLLTVAFDDLKACGSMAAAKEKGLLRLEGKDYVMQDGDITNFRFSIQEELPVSRSVLVRSHRRYRLRYLRRDGRDGEREPILFGVLFLSSHNGARRRRHKGRAARLVPAADVHKLCLCGDRRGQRIAGVS